MNTDRTSCTETREKLPLYVGGDLDGDVMEAVRGHLDACAECALRMTEALRARRELLSALRGREADYTAPGLWPGLRAKLRAEGLVHPSTPQRLPRPMNANQARWTWALVPAAAAAILLALLQLSGGVDESTNGAGGDGIVDVPAPRLAPAGGLPPGTEVVAVPVSTTGGLQRVDPGEESSLPTPFRRPATLGTAPVSSSGDISLTGFK